MSREVRANVSNEDLGKLRIQFFRDAVHALASHSTVVPRAPVVEALAEAYALYPHISIASCHRLLDARERDLAYPNIQSLTVLEDFAGDTQGTLAFLHAQVLHDGYTNVNQKQLEEATASAGKAIGLTVLLRGAPAHAASRLSYMPRELINKLNVPHAHLLQGQGRACELFEAVADAATRHSSDAATAAATLPSQFKPAFWCLKIADIYLSRLRKAGYNPFDDRLQRSMLSTYPLRLQMSLLKSRIFGT